MAEQCAVATPWRNRRRSERQSAAQRL
jgi:hypothetical protein